MLIKVKPVRPKGSNHYFREQKKKADHRQAVKALAFAQELNLAGVSAKVKTKSVVMQNHLTTREARLAIKLSKPRKHRSRRGLR